MTNRLLAVVALAGAFTAAGCGLVGNEGERQAAVVKAILPRLPQRDGAGRGPEPGGAAASTPWRRDAETWEKAIRKLRAGLMPPADGGPTLDREKRDALVAYLENEIDRARRDAPPGPGASPAEPHRIHERDPRSAGPQYRRHEVPAGGRLQPRVRQHGRYADHVAGADGGVPVGRRQDQPSGHRHRDRARRSPCSTRRTTPRRTPTSKGCRSARAAAC